MVITKGSIAYLCIAWAFFLGLVGFGLNIPTILMILGTILFLLG